MNETAMYSKRGDNNVKTSDKAFTEHGKWTNANVVDVICS